MFFDANSKLQVIPDGGHSTGGEYWKFAFDSLAIHVPEPGTLLLLCAGLLAGLLRRRRQ